MRGQRSLWGRGARRTLEYSRWLSVHVLQYSIAYRSLQYILLPPGGHGVQSVHESFPPTKLISPVALNARLPAPLVNGMAGVTPKAKRAFKLWDKDRSGSISGPELVKACLLYTSDAADE